jgi:hypothetical protein
MKSHSIAVLIFASLLAASTGVGRAQEEKFPTDILWGREITPALDAKGMSADEAGKVATEKAIIKVIGTKQNIVEPQSNEARTKLLRDLQDQYKVLEQKVLALSNGDVVAEVRVQLRSKYYEYRGHVFTDDKGDSGEVFAFFSTAECSWVYRRSDQVSYGDKIRTVEQTLEQLFAGYQDRATLKACHTFVAVGTASAKGKDGDEEVRSDDRARCAAAALHRLIYAIEKNGPQPDVRAMSFGRYTASTEDKAEQRPLLIFAITRKRGNPDIAQLVAKCLDDRESPHWLRRDSYSRKGTQFIDWGRK